MKGKTSEFGKGFAYCLGLFLAHTDGARWDNKYEQWHSGAKAHLFEICYHFKFPEQLEVRTDRFIVDVLSYYSYGAKEFKKMNDLEFKSIIDEAKSILFEYDILCGIDAIEAECK